MITGSGSPPFSASADNSTGAASGSAPGGPMPPPPRTLTVPDSLELQAVEDPRALLAGNAVRLLRNGAEVFPAWLAAIAAAQVRISLEMYIFSDDAIGRRFAEALAE